MRKKQLKAVTFILTILTMLLIFVACDDDEECSHKWGEWTVKTSATCTNEGTQERKCSNCGEAETSSIDALGHTWKDATCTEPKTCTACNTTDGSVIAHTPNADDGDCTTAITCSVCGEVITPAKASHTGGTATCEDKAKCDVCGKEYGEHLAHTPNADDGDCTTAITCSVCGEETTPANASHTGGTATCQEKSICSVCNTVYGDYGAHSYDETTCGYKTADGHAHVCSVAGCNAHDTIISHTSSGVATETTPEKCTVCGYIINPALGHKTHTPADAWSNNATHHWHECVGCEDQEFDKAEHTYDNSCDTTCNVCGYTRIVTHSYTVLKKDANNHWYECAICNATKPNSTEAHKGGTATCEHKAKCEVCDKEYGAFKPHTPNTDDGDCTTAITCSVCDDVTTAAKTHTFDNACDTTCNNANCEYTRVTSHVPNADDGDCTTAITCSVCGTVTTPAKANHTGGTATCEHKAKCEVCNKEYGNLAAHTPNADDGDCTTAITCSVCGDVTTPARASHTGGTADCEHKAKCEVCHKEYGDFGSHVPNPDDGDCTTEITCSVCTTVTTPAKASHTGGTATCQAKAKCSECNKEYGETDPDNHANLSITGIFSECEGGTKNLRCKACRDSWQETLTAKGHNYVGGVCTVCGANKPTNDFITEYKVNADDTVTVTVKLTGVVKVAGFNVTINYDPNVLYLDGTQQGAFAVTENKGTAGNVVLVHTNSSSTTTGGTVLTLTFAIDSFENTNIELTVNEIKETWYDNSIHDTSSSATGAILPLAK